MASGYINEGGVFYWLYGLEKATILSMFQAYIIGIEVDNLSIFRSSLETQAERLLKVIKTTSRQEAGITPVTILGRLTDE